MGRDGGVRSWELRVSGSDRAVRRKPVVRSGQDASAYGFSTALRVGVGVEKVSLVGSRVMERAHSRGVRGHLVLVMAGAWRLLPKAGHTFGGQGKKPARGAGVGRRAGRVLTPYG